MLVPAGAQSVVVVGQDRQHRVAGRAVPPFMPHCGVGPASEAIDPIAAPAYAIISLEENAPEVLPPAPCAAVPPPVPHRRIEPAGETVDAVRAPTHAVRRFAQHPS